jgi:adenine-specific DNA methylase
MNTDDLELDLKQIATTGIIQRTTTGWLVTKFEERQAPVSGNERVKQYRDRQKKQQYYGDVTELKRDVTQRQNTDTESDTETESYISPLQSAFINASGIGSYSTADAEIYQELDKQGVSPADVTNAVRTLQGKKYTIKGPQSIVTTAINIAKQKSQERVKEAIFEEHQ